MAHGRAGGRCRSYPEPMAHHHGPARPHPAPLPRLRAGLCRTWPTALLLVGVSAFTAALLWAVMVGSRWVMLRLDMSLPRPPAAVTTMDR